MVQVREILVSSRRLLVHFEVIERDDRDVESVDVELHRASSTGVVIHAVNRRHELNAKRRHSESNDAAGIGEELHADGRSVNNGGRESNGRVHGPQYIRHILFLEHRRHCWFSLQMNSIISSSAEIC